MTVAVPATCSTPDPVCSLDADFSNVQCFDNGTPSDASDDTFSFDVSVTGMNGSAQGYVVRSMTGSPVASGQYDGTTITVGPLSILDQNGDTLTSVSYTVTDVTDPTCSEVITVPVPRCDVPAACDLEIEIVSTQCFDQGTPQGGDDMYTFDVLATGANGTYTITYDSAGVGITRAGTFGVTMTYGPVPADQPVNGNLMPNDPTCNDVGAFFVTPTGPCTDCVLTVEELSNVCNDNGTATPDDDFFTVTLRITGIEASFGYMTILPNGSTLVGAYSTDSIQVLDFPIAGGPVTLEFMDMGEPDACSATITLTPPATCSPCDVSAAIVDQTPCNDNGTPFDGGDDTFTVTVNVTGLNTGADWVIPGTTITGTYGTDVTVTLPADGQTTTWTIVDGNDGNCTTTVSFTAPTNCVQDVPCDLDVELITAPVCDSDGMGYVFSVIVTNPGSNAGGGWTASNGQSGSYGVVTVIDNLDDCSDLTVVFTDADDMTCRDTIVVQSPPVDVICPSDTSIVNNLPLLCGDEDAIFNNPASQLIVGFATITGCGFDDLGFVDTYLPAGSCDDIVIRRTYSARTCDGTIVSSSQLITIRKPRVTDVIFPTADLTFDCDETFDADDNGNPATSVSGVPYLVSALRDSILIEDVYCGNLSVSYVDAIDTVCANTAEITRTWTATDLCTGAVRTATQIIRVGDASAPTVSCSVSNHYCPVLDDDIMLFPMDGFDCVATFDVPTPDVTDACSNSWTILTEVLDSDSTVVLTLTDGDARVARLGAGDYTVRYYVTDDCGNMGTTDCIIRVADTQEPAAICIGDINLSIGGYGLARVYTQMVDLGSYDNCGIDSIMVRRQLLVDPMTGDSLATPTWSAWGDYATMECNDAGTTVLVEMRVVDLAGNANVCTARISVVDNTLPYCTGLDDLMVNCTDLPDGFIATDTLSLQTAFGMPTVIDNCAATAIELDPIVNVDDCVGAGTITRRWLAVDGIGNISAQEFRQTITIEANDGFTLVVPADIVTECIDDVAGMEILGQGCADLSVSFLDREVAVTAADSGACLVIERTYTVVNNCVFDPATGVTLDLGRDEACTGSEGAGGVYAIVSGDSTYIDTDTDFTNATPAADASGCTNGNPAGYLRAARSTGAWTYTQRIAINDVTRPELAVGATDVFCATENGNCEAMINIPITVNRECTAAGSQWLVLVDLGRDGSTEMNLPAALSVQGTFPNYFIEASLPIGQHSLMVRYVDGCSNSAVAMIPFEVADCSIPDPTCYSGLIANIETLDKPVRTDDDNVITEGVYVEAGRLASCDVTDCSGPLRFSVNRVGETPNVDSTRLLLTCDDRYSVMVEVYTWDSAFNPLAEQPDGSVGGPNWKMCVVEVLVQDPDRLCNDCAADGGITIGGEFRTRTGVVLPKVEVEMTGAATGLEISDDNGAYAFPDMVTGDYQLEPYKDDLAANGVSTIDELILTRHLLGIEPITDPLIFMAADLNNSGTLTVLDRLIMRNIILGNTEVLPGNETWRFVPESMVDGLSIEQRNLVDAPRVIILEGITSCTMNNNFIGIKLGDLNNSVYVTTSTGTILNGTRGRSSIETYELEIEERTLRGGEFFDLPVRAGDLNELSGMQFTLAFAVDKLQIVEVMPALIDPEQLGLTRTERGMVSANLTIDAARAYATEEVLFSVRVKALRPTGIGSAVSLMDDPTFTEAYTAVEEEIMPIDLRFVPGAPLPTTNGGGVVAGVELGAPVLDQNFPNPFTRQTSITFTLPRDGAASLHLYDLHGRVLQTVENDYHAGQHTVNIDGSSLISGTMVYTLTYEGKRMTRTMIRM